MTTQQITDRQIPEFVAQARRRSGQTQAQIAEALGVTQTAVSQAELGNPGMSSLRIRILEHLGYTVDVPEMQYHVTFPQ